MAATFWQAQTSMGKTRRKDRPSGRSACIVSPRTMSCGAMIEIVWTSLTAAAGSPLAPASGAAARKTADALTSAAAAAATAPVSPAGQPGARLGARPYKRRVHDSAESPSFARGEPGVQTSRSSSGWVSGPALRLGCTPGGSPPRLGGAESCRALFGRGWSLFGRGWSARGGAAGAGEGAPCFA